MLWLHCDPAFLKSSYMWPSGIVAQATPLAPCSELVLSKEKIVFRFEKSPRLIILGCNYWAVRKQTGWLWNKCETWSCKPFTGYIVTFFFVCFVSPPQVSVLQTVNWASGASGVLVWRRTKRVDLKKDHSLGFVRSSPPLTPPCPLCPHRPVRHRQREGNVLWQGYPVAKVNTPHTQDTLRGQRWPTLSCFWTHWFVSLGIITITLPHPGSSTCTTTPICARILHLRYCWITML